ncbi:MAG: ABC transporter substrate-binding protein [Oscillospiraceae bacterium]|nr:ABC transporter substrate-binding protein [Oscillospiraceae bacterium]
MRKWLVAVLAAALLTGVFFLIRAQLGADAVDEANGNHTEMPMLIYYTIGAPDADLEGVNRVLNELLAEKIGVTVDYRKIAWGEYQDRLNRLIDSGQVFDIAFAMNYAQHANRGAWLRLDDYLAPGGIGHGMYKVVDATFWEGARVGDGIYGVPTNKELAVVDQWMYPKALIDEYGIDINRYTTLESLEPLFAMIAAQEPDYLVMELDSRTNNFFSLYGFEYVYDISLPLVVRSLSDKPLMINPFVTAEGREILDTLRRYYLAGYINEDAAFVPSTNLVPGKKVFFRMASGGPHSAPIWTAQRQYPVEAAMVGQPIVTTESTQGAVMSISANTRYPEECVAFLNCLNTDPEVRNLLNYGIEGLHYELDENDQAVVPEEVGYAGVQYTQGNWFILHTRGGENPEPLDKWEQYRAYNASAVKSNILGFVPDLSEYGAQLDRVAQVCGTYYPALMTGSVDVDEFLPEFLNNLSLAGLDDIQEELQAQLEAWWRTH